MSLFGSLFGRNTNNNRATKMKFVGTDTVLNGRRIEHGKEYAVKHTNRRSNGWIWVDIDVDGKSVSCPYSSVWTFAENWEPIK